MVDRDQVEGAVVECAIRRLIEESMPYFACWMWENFQPCQYHLTFAYSTSPS